MQKWPCFRFWRARGFCSRSIWTRAEFPVEQTDRWGWGGWRNLVWFILFCLFLCRFSESRSDSDVQKLSAGPGPSGPLQRKNRIRQNQTEGSGDGTRNRFWPRSGTPRSGQRPAGSWRTRWWPTCRPSECRPGPDGSPSSWRTSTNPAEPPARYLRTPSSHTCSQVQVGQKTKRLMSTGTGTGRHR